MARATFVKSAQKNIYENGKRVEYISEKGKREGQTLTKTDKTMPADENDKIFIAKGESYYWWQFLHRPKNYSKTAPKPSQLTTSSFLSTLYDLQERQQTLDGDGLEDFISDIESLKEECENSLDNVPDSLKEAPTGVLLQERIDALEDWKSELESIDTEIDEDAIRDQAKEEVSEDGEENKVNTDEIEEKFEELLQERKDEIEQEITNCECQI